MREKENWQTLCKLDIAIGEACKCHYRPDPVLSLYQLRNLCVLFGVVLSVIVIIQAWDTILSDKKMIYQISLLPREQAYWQVYDYYITYFWQYQQYCPNETEHQVNLMMDKFLAEASQLNNRERFILALATSKYFSSISIVITASFIVLLIYYELTSARVE